MYRVYIIQANNKVCIFESQQHNDVVCFMNDLRPFLLTDCVLFYVYHGKRSNCFLESFALNQSMEFVELPKSKVLEYIDIE